jgi:hypothetical protein
MKWFKYAILVFTSSFTLLSYQVYAAELVDGPDCTNNSCTGVETCLANTDTGDYCEIDESILIGELEISLTNMLAVTLSVDLTENFSAGNFAKNIIQTSEQNFDYSAAGEGVHRVDISVQDSGTNSSSISLAFSKYLPLTDDAVSHNLIETSTFNINGNTYTDFDESAGVNVVNIFSTVIPISDLAEGINAIGLNSTDSEPFSSDNIFIAVPVYPAFKESILGRVVTKVEAKIGGTMPVSGTAANLLMSGNNFTGALFGSSDLTPNTNQMLYFRAIDSEAVESELTMYVSITDTDLDGLADILDAFPNNRAELYDTDMDGVGNNEDTDDDGDGIADINDAFTLDKTESLDTDKDGTGNNADLDDDNDGLSDEYELANELDPLESNIGVDTDGDGVDDITEFSLNLDPNLPDSDGDGLSDGDEITVGLDPSVADVADIQYQLLTPSATIIKTPVQGIAAIHWQYATSDGVKELSGLTLRIHFDDQSVEWVDNGDVFTTGFVSKGKFVDTIDSDRDSKTNSYIEFIWQDANNSWPGEFPANLLTTQFKLIVAMDDFSYSPIRITGANSPQRVIDGKMIRYAVKGDMIKMGPGFSLDITGDGIFDPFTDGMILNRYLMGYDVESIAIEEEMVGATRTKQQMYDLLSTVKPKVVM